MKYILIALLILATLQQDTVLAVSGDTSSAVGAGSQGDASTIPQQIARSKSQPAAPSDWSFLNRSSLGGNAKWITPVKGSWQIWPKWWISTYEITFATDCLKNPVSITLSATGFFQVYLNDTLIKNWQSPWPNIVTFNFTPLCGCNRLKIVVFNFWWPSPSATIYSLSQSTSGCYDCQNLGVTFYNRDTCKCECVNTYKCPNPAMQWSDVPKCACICSPQRSDSQCGWMKYWNMKNCNCQCRKLCCPKGYYQDPKTCYCQPTLVACPANQIWDSVQQRCICRNVLPCKGYATWNNDLCQCECDTRLIKVNCNPGYFDTSPNVCGCSYNIKSSQTGGINLLPSN